MVSPWMQRNTHDTETRKCPSLCGYGQNDRSNEFQQSNWGTERIIGTQIGKVRDPAHSYIRDTMSRFETASKKKASKAF